MFSFPEPALNTPDSGNEKAGGVAAPTGFENAHNENSEQKENNFGGAGGASPNFLFADALPNMDEAATRDHFAMLHELALAATAAQPGLTGVLKLVVIPEGAGPIIHEYKPGEVDLMVGGALRYAAREHHNVYTSWALFRPDKASKGKQSDVLAVLALVIDSDADTGKAARPPLPAPYALQTSAGNFQYVYPLARALSVEESKPIAVALTTVSGGDSRGKDVSSLWRTAGTYNWPTEIKRNRGRQPTPQVVKESQIWTGKLIEPDELAKTVAASSPHSDRRHGTEASQEEREANPGTSTAADLMKRLPKAMRLLLAAPAEPHEDRSGTAFGVFMKLIKLGFSHEHIILLVEAHPAGIGERYVNQQQKLADDVRRAFEKYEDRSKPKREGSGNNFAAVMDTLRSDPKVRRIVAHDNMSLATMLMHPVPHAEIGGAFQPRRLTDNDASQLQEYLQRHGLKRISRDLVHQGLDLLAEENSFHPVRCYLDALRWDGTKRLCSWLSRYLGAEQTEYSAEVGRMFLLSMIARVFRPGVKVDHMMVLEGPQGAFKSSVCRILAGEWYSDSLPDITWGKDVSIHLAGKWLVEIAEMQAMSKAENAALKAFITRQDEIYRPPYGRREIVQPRQCVFVGTTNKSAYLRDETGGRRFWPVKIGQIDLSALTKDRDQLLAEAVAAFHAGQCWWPTQAFEARVISFEQAARFETDVWMEAIEKYLSERSVTTISDIACDALRFGLNRTDKVVANRVRAVLEMLGWARNGRKDSRNRRELWTSGCEAAKHAKQNPNEQ